MVACAITKSQPTLKIYLSINTAEKFTKTDQIKSAFGYRR